VAPGGRAHRSCLTLNSRVSPANRVSNACSEPSRVSVPSASRSTRPPSSLT
jgi:hypothetical protein